MALGQTLAIRAPALINGVTANLVVAPPSQGRGRVRPSAPVIGTSPHCLRLKASTRKGQETPEGQHPRPEGSGFFPEQQNLEGPGCPLGVQRSGN